MPLRLSGRRSSGFQNIPTANGSSSATGPWQITAGTFQTSTRSMLLGYSASDITNPTAQAAVASYIIKDYASTVSQATQQPATVVQTYGAYVFGPSAGANIATADPSTPLSQFVSATALANNNMQGWTVGQFNRRWVAGSARPRTTRHCLLPKKCWILYIVHAKGAEP